MTHTFDFNSLLHQLLGSRFGDIPGNTPDLEFLRHRSIGKDGLDYGTSLVAGGAKDGNELRHGELMRDAERNLDSEI